ncbi:ribosomal protein S18-alanine N-acetyltransferase [Ferrimonas gelatinilytica]|uniref:[Ribosomal protein bS18]-alanine N-acetyltransferase n=1 Tax=Ferrimonas gelatinilytica TaxID=1255257 RepID=A0ABP9S5J1_9GAMM
MTFAPLGTDWLSPERLDRLYEVERSAHPYPWSRETLASSLQPPYWGEVLLVEDGGALGFCLFQQVLDEVTLMNLCVVPTRQGSGLGRALLERGLESARARGARFCYLEVRAGNAAAVGLYRKLGFQEDGRRKGYYPGGAGREDAVLMSQALD